MSVEDYTAFRLCETDLTEKKVGDYVLTPKRAVPCSKGLEWWIRWYPSGQTEANDGHVSVFLWVNMPVEATVTFAVDDSSITQTFTYEFADSPDSYGFIDFASHEELRPLFLDGKLTIRCTAEFTCSIRSIHVAPAFYRMLEYSPPDFDLVVGQNRIQVHKNFISLISPVYFAMLQNKSICESGSVETVVTDFDYDVVKTAIDYSYGRKVKLLSAKTYVGVLRYANKMDMKKIIANWERLIPSNLSAATFCDFLQYAYDFEKNALLDECYKYFKTNQDQIKEVENFAELSPPLVVKVLKAAFKLKSDDQVARHAHINDINFIRDYFEIRFINALSVENFHVTASYAWEYSRESLQKACAKFLNDNREKVTTDNAFLGLPAEKVSAVLKFAAKEKLDVKLANGSSQVPKKAKSLSNLNF